MDNKRQIPHSTFYLALARAKIHLFSQPIQLSFNSKHSLAVSYEQDTQTHILYTTFKSSFINQLQDSSGLSLEDCCFLALAHESGHVELNQRCVDQGLDPADSNAQLVALSRKGSKLGANLDAQCHKESSIEAFCDAKLAAAIFTYFPQNAMQLLQIIADIRKTESSKPHRFGDDYLTFPIFKEMIKTGRPLDGLSASKLAYENSKISMSLAENIWLCIKRPILKKIQSWQESRKTTSEKKQSHKTPDSH